MRAGLHRGAEPVQIEDRAPLSPAFGELPQQAVAVVRETRYGIAPREDGQIATVRITRGGRVSWDLPGGAIDPGETAREALRREFIEETGWSVEPLAVVTAARQFTHSLSNGEYRDNRSLYYACRLGRFTGEKIEADHELVWLDPHAALTRLRHEAAAWAVTAWLRRQAGREPPGAG